MNYSLRRRLLAGITATTVAGFAIAAVTIFIVLRASLQHEADLLLASKAQGLATLMKQHGEAIEIEFAEHPMQEFARKVEPDYFQVWDEDGTVLARSRRLKDADLKKLRGSLANPGFAFVTLPDRRPGRLEIGRAHV